MFARLAAERAPEVEVRTLRPGGELLLPVVRTAPDRQAVTVERPPGAAYGGPMPRRPPTMRARQAARAVPPPQLPAGPALLPRPALVARLAALSRRTLTLLVAPTGYGKTTLVAEWAEAETRPVVRLALEPADADGGLLWARLAGAIGAGAGSAQPDALLNALAESTKLVLVLDDYQALGGACDDDVSYLLERLPQPVSVLVASRSEPGIDLAPIAAAGGLGRLGAADLRFDAVEIAAAADLAGTPLAESELDPAAAVTEGWPAGVRLACAALRGPEGLAGFDGTCRAVVEYFEEEVLDGLDPGLREFLVRSSVLERLSAPLCDGVLGRGDSAERLAEAERGGLFLFPVGRGRTVVRHHPLFRAFLQTQLDGASRLQLHRRAATALADTGAVADAVAHAAACGRPAARALLLRNWRALAAHERIDEAERSLAASGSAAPPLAESWVAAARGRETDRPRRGVLPFGTGDRELEDALVRTWFSAGDIAGALRLRARVDALPERDELLDAAATGALAHALHAAGRDDEALAAAERLDLSAAAEAPAPAVRTLAVRARACARLERPAAAAAALRTAAALVERHGLAGTPAAELLPREREPAEPERRRPGGDLTRAELTVLRLLTSRLTQREIAAELYLSANTVKTHVASIHRKLGVSGRAEAVAAARRLNLLPG